MSLIEDCLDPLTIGDAWREHLFGMRAHEHDAEEIAAARRAFYAGALAAVRVLWRIPTPPELVNHERTQALCFEFDAYSLHVAAGTEAAVDTLPEAAP